MIKNKKMISQQLKENLRTLLVLPALMFAAIAVFMPFIANLLYNYLLVYFELEGKGNEGLQISIFLFGLVGMGVSVICLFACVGNAFPNLFETEEQRKGRAN